MVKLIESNVRVIDKAGCIFRYRCFLLWVWSEYVTKPKNSKISKVVKTKISIIVLSFLGFQLTSDVKVSSTNSMKNKQKTAAHSSVCFCLQRNEEIVLLITLMSSSYFSCC